MNGTPFTVQVRNVMREHGVKTADIWTNKTCVTVKCSLWHTVHSISAMQHALTKLCEAAGNGATVSYKRNDYQCDRFVPDSMLVRIPNAA